ncbi:adenosylcobinamide-GDP ribazoletransferase [Candidatus Magnetaquicoccus inordinatus]|uniref:adenosylcobinamide-GDP ribazoletransferase n=1 Tax=Candidatus Magnetaquicoccus inordinatus TaxID=2496818 RepID=UPI00102BE042|nr:adenosylcobinamide-GDP ribazoletransferase [Candidatus Magnetaquicoccus inordinatus]
MPILRALLIALGLLTRFPLPTLQPTATENEYGRSVLAYPLVGALIGLLLTLAAILLLPWIPKLILASALLILWVWCSGALHLDGLADSADAWVGGMGDRQRTLQLMKDPHCGSSAVVTLVLLLLLKWSSLLTLLDSPHLPLFWLSPFLGRSALLLLLLTTPYVRPEGMGASAARSLPHKSGWLLLLSLTLLCCLLAWPLALLAITSLLLLFVLFRQALLKRLSGTTGDTAGALCELSETITLLALTLAP